MYLGRLRDQEVTVLEVLQQLYYYQVLGLLLD